MVYSRSLAGYTDVIAGVGAAAFISLFLAFAVAMVADGQSDAAPLILIAVPMWLLFFPATIQGLVRLAQDRAVLELAPHGLRLPGLGWIPWTDIERMEIEDTRSLVERPGTTVVGSMRQLAIHLRDGAQARSGNRLDRALRSVGRGFLALGAAAGKGRYHWLAVPERFLGVPLEEVLDVASVYHARVVGLAAYQALPGESTASTASTPTPLPADAAPTASPDPVLAAEAAALFAIERAATTNGRPGPRQRLRWAWTLVGGVGVIAIAALFGIQMMAPRTAGPAGAAPNASGTGEVQFRASGHTRDGGPELVIDGNADTAWNAGASPPGWIELDLGIEGPVASIRLLVEQTPGGPTVHNVHVASDGGAYEFVHTFEGETTSGHWLTFRPRIPLSTVRKIVIETVSGPSWVPWREIVVERP